MQRAPLLLVVPPPSRVLSGVPGWERVCFLIQGEPWLPSGWLLLCLRSALLPAGGLVAAPFSCPRVVLLFPLPGLLHKREVPLRFLGEIVAELEARGQQGIV